MAAPIPQASPSNDSERDQSPHIPEDRVYNSNVDSSTSAAQSVQVEESWDNWGDRDVWLAAQRMLGMFKRSAP